MTFSALNAMEPNSIEDRILHAKKLLKKHQYRNEYADGYSNNTEQLKTGNLTGYQQRDGSTSEMPPSTSPSTCNESMDELSSLRALCRRKDVELQELTGRLQQLHNSYVEVYSAYNNLAQSENAATAPQSEYALQISQLQTALSVSTEEQTNLRSLLRDARSQLQTLEAETKRRQEASTSVNSLSAKLESEIIALKDERTHLFETIANQSQQIETERKASSQLEAKILLIQQDRNEMQARLKFVCEEKRHLEETLAQLRCDLNMKEIYIRQLSHFSDSNPAVDQRTIQTLTEERAKASEEAAEKQSKLVELRKQFDSSCQHYENCFGELRQHITALEAENQRLTLAKTELESVRSYHEEQLRLLKKEAADVKTEEEDKIGETVNADELAALQEGFASLECDFLRSRERIQDLERTVEQRDSQLETLQFDYINLQRNIVDLEESNKLHTSINSDVTVLSEQLQNEKATVSRAVEQNMQLKRQLEELQDKLISVTNESAAKEDERLTALNRVRVLTERLEGLEKSCDSYGVLNGIGTYAKNNNEEPSAAVILDAIRTTAVNDYKTNDKPRVVSLVDNELSVPSTDKPESVVNQTDYDNRKNSLRTVAGIQNLTSPTVLNSPNAEISRHQQPSPTSDAAEPDRQTELETQLRAAAQREAELQRANERLEYLLTVLETENESIGEYIALYRYQRDNLQKRLRNAGVEQHQPPSPINHSGQDVEKKTTPKCTYSSVSVDGIPNGMKCSGCVECRGELMDL